MAANWATQTELAMATASVLGLDAESPEIDVTVIKDARGAGRHGLRHLVGMTHDYQARAYIAPDLERLDEIAAALPRLNAERRMVHVATPASIAAVREADTMRERSDAARLSLAADLNRWSARDVMTPYQGSLLTLLAVGFLAAVAQWGGGVGFGLHLGFTMVAFVCTAFRAIVLLSTISTEKSVSACPLPIETGSMPLYSVLVALHREAEMAPSLAAAMAALDWPASRLEVFFVCEATDPETIAAIESAIVPYPHFSVVVTPASNPTTKPKALNFALPLTRGDYVVLYDAEDIPHPGQLRDAWTTFHNADDRLACLQAPLVVTNGTSGWRQAHYAIEYAVLFRMLLPWLAARSLPLPLGGTSNHFRRKHLMSAGGWDSHNVAEDADLGVRLARLGFRTGTISSPTLETSTVRWPDWRNQRTRWIKGWIQTWLVHMRDPLLTSRQLGLTGMAAFQIVFLGMVASSFAHIALLVQLAALGLTGALLEAGPSHGWLYAIDAGNLVLACLVFSASFLHVALPGERPLATKLWAVWAYWGLVSYAGIRAMWQLSRNPHLWEKTPHTAVGKVPAPSGDARRPAQQT